jgi:hypothetical protein
LNAPENFSLTDKEKLKKAFARGTKYFLQYPKEVKTPIYSRFIKDVCEPLSLALKEELKKTESPETLAEVNHICDMFQGLVVRVRESKHLDDTIRKNKNVDNKSKS